METTRLQKVVFIFLLSVFAIFAYTSIAYGQTPISGAIDSPNDEKIKGINYDSDVFFSGMELITIDQAKENLFAIGMKLQIEEKVRNSAFLIGQNINVFGDIKANLFVVGSDIQVKGDIDEDAYIVGDRILISGDIDDDLYVSAKEIFIDKIKIKDDLYLNAQMIKISEGAVFEGKININGKEMENIENYRTIDIPVDLSMAQKTKGFYLPSFDVILLTIGMIIGESLLGVLLFKYLGKKMNGVVDNLSLENKEVFCNIKTGFIGMLLITLAIFILALSIIGWPILIMMIIMFVAVSYVAEISYVYKFGSLFLGKVMPKVSNTFLKIFFGYVLISIVMILLSLIPLVGELIIGVLSIFIALWSFGAVFRRIKDDYKSSK